MSLGHSRRMSGHHVHFERQIEIAEKTVAAHQRKVGKLSKGSKRLNVGVIGGGLAGLYSAHLLSELGHRVTVYEASDRVGGRVHSLYNFSKGRIVEAGAEYIGLNHGAWLSLARKFGLGLVDITSNNKITGLNLESNIVLNSKTFTGPEAEKLESEMNKVFDRIALDAESITYSSRPWLECEEIRKLDDVSLGEKLDEWGITGDVRELFDIFYENENAASAYVSSYLGELCAIKGGCIDGKTKEFYDIYQLFKCADGNQALAFKLAENINRSKRCKLVLASPVTNVCYDGHSFTLKTFKKSYKHDYVVMAVPPSVWSNIHFSPSFDAKLYESSLGPAIKYLSAVKSRFWISKGISPNGVNEAIGETFEATENQTFKDGQDIDLTVFAGGRYATKALEFYEKKWYPRHLDKSFEGAFSKNFKHDALFDYPTTKHIETGYAYLGLGKVTTISKRVQEPLPEYDNKLYLAGDHTSIVHCGYMEGALQSALRVVKQLTAEAV